MMDKIQFRITKIREKMEFYGIDAYLVVSDDFHGSEYVSDYFKCREYLSGFTGSAGTLLITKEWAGLWTDGRYFLQAEAQLENTGITLMKMGEEGIPTIKEYLKENLPKQACFGYDGRTIRVKYAKSLKEALTEHEIKYMETIDLVGELWENRPAFPNTKLWELSEQYTGQSRRDKLETLRQQLKEEGADAILLASLDDIAWLYNIRGNDIAYNPVALSYSIIYKDSAVLYRDESSMDEPLIEALKIDDVTIAPYLQIYEDVQRLKDIKLFLDENAVNVALYQGISKGATIIKGKNPTTLLKAKKNPVEVENERYAHLWDGVAVTKLIYWLKKKLKNETIEKITELDVCEKLESLRKRGEHYLGQSFAPIVATGAHGAIVHYEPTESLNAPLEKDNFVLLDTGGQYLYGTTDVTRTVALGKLTEEQKLHYTAVLKGHINLEKAKFKHGCTGANLDYLARSPLWEMGLDYNHGTGHGVGYLLNVHEGPNGIRLKEADGTVGTVLEEGMITSNEPGVYLTGKYGIRIENMILCKKGKQTDFGQFMEFETLTMVPYERDAILFEMLTEEEKMWLNQYHKEVYEEISPYLEEDEKEWLKEQM